MKYYRALIDIYLQKRVNNRYYSYFTPKNALITPTEIEKLKVYYNFNIDNFEIVSIPKNKTYVFFGVRKISKENEKIFYNKGVE